MENANNSVAPVAQTAPRESLAVPIAIVIAAGLIAGAIYLGGGKTQPTAVRGTDQGAAAAEATTEFRAVDDTDHIRGNPNAPILFVEYSDYDCPFCKNFHDTMNQLMREYGESGKIAWVYRHMPLEQLHPNAPKIAEAAECVAKLGGNDAFWKFSDRVFNEKTTRDLTVMSRITEYATGAGVDKEKFENCYASGEMADKITASLQEGAAAGVRGTPHTFVIVGDDKTTINGAQPYSVVKQITDGLLEQLEGGTKGQ